MPFEPIYAVAFASGVPFINTKGWGRMEFSSMVPENSFEWNTDGDYPVFTITRRPPPPPPPPPPPVPPPPPGRCHLFVRTPGLDVRTRLRMQLVFAHPHAEFFGSDGQLHELDTYPFPDSETTPESWAVALNVFPKIPDQNTDDMVRLTCQFNRAQGEGGIRLNTPGSREDGAEVVQMMKPLSYSTLRKGTLILEHSFCGLFAEAEDHRYVIGSGELTWKPPYNPTSEPVPLKDQRLYSSTAFHPKSPNPQAPPPPPLLNIAALGMTLITLGFGRVRFTPAAFVVWENKPYPQATALKSE